MNLWMVASTNWLLRLSKVGRGMSVLSPCPSAIPSPVLGGWWGWTGMGREGVLGEFSSGPTAPCAKDVLTLGKGHAELCHCVALLSPAVMKFMGDHPLRGQTELDAVCTILKVNPSLGW